MVFFVSSAGMLPVVPLPPRPLPRVCDLQRAPEGEGLNAHWSCTFVELKGDRSLQNQKIHICPLLPSLTLSSVSVGGDHRCDPLPVHLHGDPLPALPVSVPLLGGLLSLLRVPATHHVQDEPQGALLSTPTAALSPIITSEGEHAAPIPRLHVPSPGKGSRA